MTTTQNKNPESLASSFAITSTDENTQIREHGLTRRSALSSVALSGAAVWGALGSVVGAMGSQPAHAANIRENIQENTQANTQENTRENTQAASQPEIWLQKHNHVPQKAASVGLPLRDYQPVITPNNISLPFKIKRDTLGEYKVFHLVAMPVDQHEMCTGLVINCWGYNGRVHGPTIEMLEGERIRIYVTNRLPEPTTVHWHGLPIICGMDGVAGLTQVFIKEGETHQYDFIAPAAGTYMYHPHYDEMTQMALGMMGMIVIHPRRVSLQNTKAKNKKDTQILETPTISAQAYPPVDRDFAILLSEWRVLPGASRPDPLAMNDFNMLTMNAKAYPSTAPLVIQQGDRVRIRLGNLSSMDHHSIHMHGHSFFVTATDGGPIAPNARWPEATVLVPVGSTRTIEFVAENLGDWAMHCHMTHHVMNQMGHNMPNLIGADVKGLNAQIRKSVPHYMTMGHTGMGGMGDMPMATPSNSIPMKGGKGPFGTIDMGGMFTILKVRDKITKTDASGWPQNQDVEWYAHPQNTVAGPAKAESLAADEIDLNVQFTR